ncbi:MAG: hypothetical protein QJR03_02825 [Sphaerobacter sp.]|nr:hypothetical protein [Sphaerobacter sp.]
MRDDPGNGAISAPARGPDAAAVDSAGVETEETSPRADDPVDAASAESAPRDATADETRSLDIVRTDAPAPLAEGTVRNEAAEPRAPWVVRRQTPLMLGVMATLILALVFGGIYAAVEISRRDAAIAKHQATIDGLSAANLSFQEQIADLTNQRDELTRERDSLTARVADLEGRVAELNQTLAERDRLLSQAREESSRQQSRAEAAEAVGMTLAMILDVDEQIHQTFVDLLVAVGEMEEATRYRDGLAYQRAYDRAVVLMGRIDELFAQREELIATLPW